MHVLTVRFIALPNDPAAHSSHTLAFMPLQRPAGHPRGVTVPAGQANPAGQPCTSPRKLQYVPAEHVTGLLLVLPSAHVIPSSHAPLQFADVIPNSEPYLPAAHSVHDVDPVVLYDPGLQMLVKYDDKPVVLQP